MKLNIITLAGDVFFIKVVFKKTLILNSTVPSMYMKLYKIFTGKRTSTPTIQK